MARIVHPNGVTTIHHDGKLYHPDKKTGVFDAPDTIVSALLPHGFKTKKEQADAAADAANKAKAAAAAAADVEANKAKAAAAEAAAANAGAQ
jgi:hypothetical protein